MESKTEGEGDENGASKGVESMCVSTLVRGVGSVYDKLVNVIRCVHGCSDCGVREGVAFWCRVLCEYVTFVCWCAQMFYVAVRVVPSLSVKT